MPVQTVLASPPEGNWPYGWYDLVVMNTDGTKVWPTSGLQGLSFTTHIFMVSYPDQDTQSHNSAS